MEEERNDKQGNVEERGRNWCGAWSFHVHAYQLGRRREGWSKQQVVFPAEKPADKNGDGKVSESVWDAKEKHTHAHAYAQRFIRNFPRHRQTHKTRKQFQVHVLSDEAKSCPHVVMIHASWGIFETIDVCVGVCVCEDPHEPKEEERERRRARGGERDFSSNKAPFMCLESGCQGMLSEDGQSYASEECLLWGCRCVKEGECVHKIWNRIHWKPRPISSSHGWMWARNKCNKNKVGRLRVKDSSKLAERSERLSGPTICEQDAEMLFENLKCLFFFYISVNFRISLCLCFITDLLYKQFPQRSTHNALQLCL